MSSDKRPDPSPERFGKHLARLRDDAGLSQSGLARRIGISQSAISQIEAGDRSPSYGMLVQIAEALGVSLAYLLGAPVEQLTSEEETHFRRYRALPVAAQKELEAYVEFLQSKYARSVD
jgi:transcriptional regulator with XRE-family HTH domain